MSLTWSRSHSTCVWSSHLACDWMRLRTSSARLVVVLIVVVGLLCLIVTLKTGRGEWNGGMENVGESSTWSMRIQNK